MKTPTTEAERLEVLAAARADTEYYETVVLGATVEPSEEGEVPSFMLATELGHTRRANPQNLPLPVKGETARFYGSFGLPIRGLSIGDRVYTYSTKAEADAEHALWVANLNTQREAAYEANRTAFEAEVERLPEAFRKRIKRFMQKPGWAAEFGAYELATCKEAIKIADALGSAEAVLAFSKAGYDEQMRLVPGLDDGLTGNMMGAATSLAYLSFNTEDSFVEKQHGAMHWLVGCADYGCWAVSAEAKALKEAHAAHRAQGVREEGTDEG